jgi:hypothetical protein
LERHWRHFAGKITEKRHNFDPSSPPASAENLHFTLNREARRAPWPLVARAQTAWEDADQMSFVVPRYPTDKPGPEQQSPLARLTYTRGKRETDK